MSIATPHSRSPKTLFRAMFRWLAQLIAMSFGASIRNQDAGADGSLIPEDDYSGAHGLSYTLAAIPDMLLLAIAKELSSREILDRSV